MPFSSKSDCKKEKSVVSFTHEQSITCSETKWDDIAHEQTIILFVGSYLQVTWWLLANEKKKIESNDNDNY